MHLLVVSGARSGVGKGFFLVLSGAARNCLRTGFGLLQPKGVFGSRRIWLREKLP